MCTPPAFRPIHLEYAVEQGRNVFMEKSFAVDAAGIRRVLAAGKKAAEKNLKIAGGLMSRHNMPLEEAVQKIHGGAIGKVITCWAYRENGPVGFTPKSEGMSELANQIRNYSCYTWLNGSFLLDWLIHNLDVCCWVKDAWPVSAQGQGGRQVRKDADQLFDHYAVEYTFADGTRLFAQGRHMANCWGFFGDVIHGQDAAAVLGEGIPLPRIYKSHHEAPDNLAWQYQGPDASSYDREHQLLFDAIRNDTPYNDGAVRGSDDRHPRPHGRRVGQAGCMGRSDQLRPRAGPGIGEDRQPRRSGARRTRRPGPVSGRHAGVHQGALTGSGPCLQARLCLVPKLQLGDPPWRSQAGAWERGMVKTEP